MEKKATRDSYGEALVMLAEKRPDLVVLDADLAAATKTGTFKAAYPEARISPVCDDNMVRPWIYAAYMGAPAYLMDAKEILLDADAWGSPTVDRAHNANVCIFAVGADDEDTVKALVRVGCDAVLTGDAKMARALVW